MTFLNFYGGFEDFTLPTVIIAVLIAVIGFLIDKFAFKNLNITVKSYIPFAVGVLLYYVYDLIFISKQFTFNAEIISMGVICGSLSTIIYAFIRRIFNGYAPTTDSVLLIIEGILKDYVSDTALSICAKAVQTIIEEYSGDNETEEKIDKIAVTIKEHSDKQFTDSEFYSAAKLTASAVEEFKKR